MLSLIFLIFASCQKQIFLKTHDDMMRYLHKENQDLNSSKTLRLLAASEGTDYYCIGRINRCQYVSNNKVYDQKQIIEDQILINQIIGNSQSQKIVFYITRSIEIDVNAYELEKKHVSFIGDPAVDSTIALISDYIPKNNTIDDDTSESIISSTDDFTSESITNEPTETSLSDSTNEGINTSDDESFNEGMVSSNDENSDEEKSSFNDESSNEEISSSSDESSNEEISLSSDESSNEEVSSHDDESSSADDSINDSPDEAINNNAYDSPNEQTDNTALRLLSQPKIKSTINIGNLSIQGVSLDINFNRSYDVYISTLNLQHSTLKQKNQNNGNIMVDTLITDFSTIVSSDKTSSDFFSSIKNLTIDGENTMTTIHYLPDNKFQISNTGTFLEQVYDIFYGSIPEADYVYYITSRRIDFESTYQMPVVQPKYRPSGIFLSSNYPYIQFSQSGNGLWTEEAQSSIKVYMLEGRRLTISGNFNSMNISYYEIDDDWDDKKDLYELNDRELGPIVISCVATLFIFCLLYYLTVGRTSRKYKRLEGEYDPAEPNPPRDKKKKKKKNKTKTQSAPTTKIVTRSGTNTRSRTGTNTRPRTGTNTRPRASTRSRSRTNTKTRSGSRSHKHTH